MANIRNLLTKSIFCALLRSLLKINVFHHHSHNNNPKLILFSILVEQSSDQHLAPNAPNNSQAKRSNSCTPLLDVENGRKNRRRSSSVHALLQIRRDSAKISEELANLTAQLSVSMTNNNSITKRSSLSVPNSYEPGDNKTPTIAQLLAETSVNQPIIIPTSFLTVNPKRRKRS